MRVIREGVLAKRNYEVQINEMKMSLHVSDDFRVDRVTIEDITNLRIVKIRVSIPIECDVIPSLNNIAKSIYDIYSNVKPIVVKHINDAAGSSSDVTHYSYKNKIYNSYGKVISANY